jgi:hypothetical protein
MSTKSDQLDQLVARLQPVRDEDLASESDTSQADALFARIVADLPVAARESPRLARRPRRWLIPAVGFATVAIAVTIAIGVGPTEETVTPAAAALLEAADAARTQDGIPPGKYLYVRSENATLSFGYVLVGDASNPEDETVDCCEALIPQVREVWLGDEPGDARLRERRVGDLRFLNESGAGAVDRARATRARRENPVLRNPRRDSSSSLVRRAPRPAGRRRRDL